MDLRGGVGGRKSVALLSSSTMFSVLALKASSSFNDDFRLNQLPGFFFPRLGLEAVEAAEGDDGRRSKGDPGESTFS